MRILAALLLSASAAAADEVVLTSGAVIEGKVVDLGDSIKVVKSNASIVYPKSMVREIRPKKTAEELYEEQARALKDGDLEGRLKLARWCVERKLAKEAAAEFRKVIALDPDHEEARKGAGYQKVGGTWMTEDEASQAKGLVRHKGRWMTPEERNLEVALEEQKELDRLITDQVKQLLEKTHSSDEKRRLEAAAGLAKIDDKYKVKHFLAAIPSSYKLTRRFVYEELGRMKEPAAAKPLVRRSLWDDDLELRDLAYETLKQIAHPDTAIFHVPFLGEESVSARIRCLQNMLAFKDLRVVPALIVALDNCLDTLKDLEKSGKEMTAVANREIIMADGSRVLLPRVVRVKPEVDRELKSKLYEERSRIVSALRSFTGQDFADDIPKWQAWWERKKAGKE
jgi:hypothetical protein